MTTKVIRKACHVKKIPSQEAKEVPRPFLQDHGMDQPLEISERRESIIITFHGRTAATLPGTDWQVKVIVMREYWTCFIAELETLTGRRPSWQVWERYLWRERGERRLSVAEAACAWHKMLQAAKWRVVNRNLLSNNVKSFLSRPVICSPVSPPPYHSCWQQPAQADVWWRNIAGRSAHSIQSSWTKVDFTGLDRSCLGFELSYTRQITSQPV